MIKRCYVTFLIMFPILLVGCLATAIEVQATEADPPHFAIDRGSESWLAKELRRNRTFPHLDMAFRKEKAGDLRGAADELEAFLAIDPHDDNVRLQRVFLLSRMGEHEQTSRELSLIITNHPNEPLLYVYRSLSLQRLDRDIEAEADLKKAASFETVSPAQRRDIQLSLAELSLSRRDYAKAASKAAEAEAGGGDYRTAMVRGLAYSRMEKHERALEAFSQARDRSLSRSQRSAALSSAAEEAIALKRYAEASDYLEADLKISQTDAARMGRLGTLLLLRGDRKAAADYYLEAVRLGDTGSRQPLVTVLKELGRLEEAERLAVALAAEAKTPEERGRAFMTLGVIREHQERYADAAEAFLKASEAQPSTIAFLALARTQARLGHHIEAREAYQKALAVSSDADARFEMAMLLAVEGHPDQAVGLLRQAIAEGLPYDKELTGWKQIGLAALANSDPILAEQMLARAMELSPQDPELARAYADAALARKSYVEAARRYQRVWVLGNSSKRENMEKDSLLKAATSWDMAGQPNKAIEEYQRYLRQPGITPKEKVSAWMAIAYLRQQKGELRAAADALIKAVESRGMSHRDREKTLLDAANLYADGEDWNKAGSIQKRVLSMKIPAGSKRASVLLKLARIEIKKGEEEGAIGYLRQAFAQPHLQKKMLIEIHDSLGHLALQKGKFHEAERNFKKSIGLGGESKARLLGFGYAIYRQGRLAEAKEIFQRAMGDESGIEAKIALARIYGAGSKYGPALHYLSLAEADFLSLPPQEQRVLFGEYGFFFDELGRHESARIWYEKSLELGNNPVIAYHLARVTLALEQPSEAHEIAESIDLKSLPVNYRVPLIVLKARLAVERLEMEKAKTFYLQAIEIATVQKEDPEILSGYWSELGKINAQEKNHRMAAQAYAKAVELSPLPAYRLAQGYEEWAVGRKNQALTLLSEAVSQEPDYLDTHKDLGYVAMQLHDNQLAVEYFCKAIDLAPLQPGITPEDPDRQSYDLHRLRGEVSTLRNRFDTDIYLTYSSGDTGTRGATPGSGLDVARSDSGIEVAWIPPKNGFRDYKIFKFIGRLTWTFDPDSLDVNSDSWTGVLGLRYKPLKAWNVNLGLEKLFAIGDDAEDQTVLRLMGSLGDGEEIDPVKKWWNYSYLFGEIDAFLESPQRITTYAEGRQGLSYKPFYNFTITPFAVADVRWWSKSDAEDISFYEGGPGLSLKYRYDETKYELARRSVELLMTYKYGRVFDSEDIEDDSIDAFFATLFFHF